MLAALPLLGLMYRFTDELSERKVGLLFGALSGIAGGYLISTSYPIAVMLSGLLLGLLVSNRLNTAAHRVCLGAVILAVLYLGNPIVPPLLVTAIALASVGDHLLGKADEPFSSLADVNIVLNALLVAYAMSGILALESIIALFLAEVAYVIGGFPFGSKKAKRHRPGA